MRRWGIKGAADDAPFFITPEGIRVPNEKRADHYREEFLRAAEVTREKLYEGTQLETPICTHSLRAMVVTYALANGKRRRGCKIAPATSLVRWSTATAVQRAVLRMLGSAI